MFTLLIIDWYQITSAMEIIGICVVLPIAIVWLINRRRTNETNKKTEIILKAIDAGVEVDPGLLGKECQGGSFEQIYRSGGDNAYGNCDYSFCLDPYHQVRV